MPLIGITSKSLSAVDGSPAGAPEAWVVDTAYAHVIVEAGGVPVPLSHSSPGNPDAMWQLFEKLDGVLIPGGTDVRPGEYGEAPLPNVDAGDAVRDEVERTVVRWSVLECKPVLGICRGMQLMNVALGGSLVQDIPALVAGGAKHDYFPADGHPRDALRHEAHLSPGGLAREILGAPRLRVNSLHHQAVGVLGVGLVATGFGPDGIVESIELQNHPFFLGVQWHAEELTRADPRMRALFRALVEAAAPARPQATPEHAAVPAAS